MIYFIKCIQNYSDVINYDKVYSTKTVHKYHLKALYRWTNKKEYKSQILQHNIYHTNIIAMQDSIFSAKVRYKKKKQLAPCSLPCSPLCSPP